MNGRDDIFTVNVLVKTVNEMAIAALNRYEMCFPIRAKRIAIIKLLLASEFYFIRLSHFIVM